MRKLAVFSVSFALGIAAAQYLLPGSRLLLGAVICFGAGVLSLLLPGFYRRRTLLVCLGLSVALGYHWLYARQIQQPVSELEGVVTELVMTLREYPEATDYGAKVTVEAEGLPGCLMYYGSEEILDLQPGQTVTASVYGQAADRIRDTDVTAFTSKGVFLLAYRRGPELIGSGTAGDLRWLPARAGHALQREISNLFRGDTAGFVTAMLTGEKTGLSEEAGIALSESGLYHILAVSGMHCGFLLALVMALTGRHRRRLTAAVAIPVLLFYALLTGASPSVVRACVMLSLLVAAPLFGRESDGPTSLLAALLLILVQNPFAVASVSLQLSFAAMAGLLWLTPGLYRLLQGEKKRGRVYSYVTAAFSATIGALAFSTPVSAWYFGALPLVAPVSNLLCLWAAGAVFVLSLLSVLAGLVFAPLGAALSILPQMLTGYILGCAGLLAAIPYHSVYFANFLLKYWLIFVYLLFGAAYLLRIRYRRKYVLAAGMAVLALCVTLRLGETRYRSGLDVLVLDVGQGQSVLLASDGTYLLADCGSGSSWYDPGEIAAHQLLAMGCRELDYLLLTHYDSDHISGVAGLMARLPVKTLLVPPGQDEDGLRDTLWETAKEHGSDIVTVRKKTELQLGKARVRVFPPVSGGSDNEQGISLLAGLGEREMLLTGDLDAAAERRLLKRYDFPAVEMLIAGHHGSKYSTSETLLETLEPEIACISVGSNSYGHPAEETLRRLAVQGCAVYRTDLQGTIHLSINEGESHGTSEEKKQ